MSPRSCAHKPWCFEHDYWFPWTPDCGDVDIVPGPPMCGTFDIPSIPICDFRYIYIVAISSHQFTPSICLMTTFDLSYLRSLICRIARTSDLLYRWSMITCFPYPPILLLLDTPIVIGDMLLDLWYALLPHFNGEKTLIFNTPYLLILGSILGVPYTIQKLILSTIQWGGSNLDLRYFLS